ncbi:MAG TPA: GNAT family N-acetyltransferase [Candidatus Woesearchaeota archaeon]|jgi:GNAT superfamily N-acetyltransferase|nr:GNAT family N-acetyltransferase [Candidatus Woesearchaeota archaeon]|tara:strand:- start:5853 stop:6425 length:573 start_codon:yes stop_codon:yes gene_type:complete
MNIVYQIRPVRSGNKFPDDINLSELENKIQGSFKIKGEKVIDGYFDEESEYYPKNLLFFIFARNKKNDGLIGGVVATSEEINDFKFTYYDKIFVIPEYQGNGIGKSLLNIARKIGDNKEILPSILRTSDEKLSERYEELSDKKMKADSYHVHGFGFYDKKTKKPKFENAAEVFKKTAKYAADKPSTVTYI